MTRLDDIYAVLEVAGQQLMEIETEYRESLGNKVISRVLLVYIKNYFENLRSSLDYLSREIYENLPPPHKRYRGSFPISSENQEAFQTFMKTEFPRLQSNNPTLYSVLENLQPYNESGCKSFPRLADLVNKNKHERLTPQTRTERKGLNIDFPGGAGIKMGPGSSISGGGTISSGSAWISPAGGTISGDSPARIGGGGVSQTVTKWISFKFDETGDEVISLLKACQNDVNRVLENVKPLVWGQSQER